MRSLYGLFGTNYAFSAILLSILALFVCAASVSAHGFDVAQSIVRGNYTYELGMTNATPTAGERVGLSFSVDENDVPIEAHEADIRISQGDAVLFASTGFHLTNETILAISYTFPSAGEYTLDFSAAGTTVSFPIIVAEKTGVEKTKYPSLLVSVTAGLLLVVMFYLWLRPMRVK